MGGYRVYYWHLMATAALIEAPVTYSSLGFILFATISVQEPVLLVLWAIGYSVYIEAPHLFIDL